MMQTQKFVSVDLDNEEVGALQLTFLFNEIKLLDSNCSVKPAGVPPVSFHDKRYER